MSARSECHDRAFRFVLEKGVPEPGVVVREVAVGFRRLGMDPGECRIDCESPQIKRLLEDPKLREPLKTMCDRGLVDYHWYRRVCKEELSRKYGFGTANRVKFIDLLLLGANDTWVIEVRRKLDYEALGQVLVHKDLLEEDHPGLGETKAAILVYEETDPLIEKTSEKLGIKIIYLQKSEK